MNKHAKYLVLALFLPLSWAAAQEAASSETASIRVVHLSPNAPEVSVTLTSTAEGGQTLSPDELTGLAYRDATGYLDVPAGEYDVTLETPEGNLAETLSFDAGGYYTVAALGLVVPENLGEQAEGEDEGNFFTNLFNNGEDQDSLALRLASYDDELPLSAVETQPANPVMDTNSVPGTEPAAGTAVGDPLAEPAPAAQTARVRLVHAAPGTAPISLVSTAGAAQDEGEPSDVVSNLAFADASSYNNLEPAEANGLEVRLEGSEAAVLTLGDASFTTNEVYTLFVIGTPVEEAPLETLLLGGEPQGGNGNGGGAASGGGN